MFVFDSDAAALHLCEDQTGALVLAARSPEPEALLFFAADGMPLRLERGPDGQPWVRPWATCGSCSLPQVLPLIRIASDRAMLAALRACQGAVTWGGGD